MVTECITLHLVLFPDLSLRDTLGSCPLQFLHLSEEDGGGGGGVRYGYSLEIADYFPYSWLINNNNKSKKKNTHTQNKTTRRVGLLRLGHQPLITNE